MIPQFQWAIATSAKCLQFAYSVYLLKLRWLILFARPFWAITPCRFWRGGSAHKSMATHQDSQLGINASQLQESGCRWCSAAGGALAFLALVALARALIQLAHDPHLAGHVGPVDRRGRGRGLGLGSFWIAAVARGCGHGSGRYAPVCSSPETELAARCLALALALATRAARSALPSGVWLCQQRRQKGSLAPLCRLPQLWQLDLCGSSPFCRSRHRCILAAAVGSGVTSNRLLVVGFASRCGKRGAAQPRYTVCRSSGSWKAKYQKAA